MKKILLLAVFLFCAATAASANEFSEFNNKENSFRAGNLPPMDEYAGVPPGLMLTAEKKEGATDDTEEGAENKAAADVISIDDIQLLYQAQKFTEAATALEPLVKGGHHGAEELMGILYRNGRGVAKNHSKAIELLSKAAEANLPLAQHHLGSMYFLGEGVKQSDPVQALMWLQIAILHYKDSPEKTQAQKDRDAIYVKLNRRDRERALELARIWLERRGEAHLLDMQ